jgi:hypothetical protein
VLDELRDIEMSASEVDSFDSSSYASDDEFTSTQGNLSTVSARVKAASKVSKTVSFGTMMSEKYNKFNQDNFDRLNKDGNFSDSEDEAKQAAHKSRINYKQFNKIFCTQPKAKIDAEYVQSNKAQKA